MSAMAAGYRSPWWGTYKKIQELGGQVRKGERSTMITFWKQLRIDDVDDNGRPIERKVFMLRVYNVFNAEQADRLGTRYAGSVQVPGDRLEAAERIVGGYRNGPTMVSDDQSMAWYRPADDRVNVPRIENMASVDAFYSTMFHELTHSTGHASRLGRDGMTKLGTHRRGETYAFEELVAEIGAALLCGQSGIDSTIANSAAYLRSWASYLRTDPKAAVRAAGQAQRAADRILGVSFADDEQAAA
jgi:antirestriction protein ArdC